MVNIFISSSSLGPPMSERLAHLFQSFDSHGYFKNKPVSLSLSLSFFCSSFNPQTQLSNMCVALAPTQNLRQPDLSSTIFKANSCCLVTQLVKLI
jgi:hypothetical protein